VLPTEAGAPGTIDCTAGAAACAAAPIRLVMLPALFRQSFGRSLVGVDPFTASKGEAVFAAGRVLEVREQAAGQIEGEVEGSHGETYLSSVRLIANGAVTRAESRCSCPVGFDCKHGAALLIAWLHTLQGTDRPNPAAAPATADARADNGGFDAMGRLQALEWVRGLRALRGPGAAPPGNRLVYVLGTDAVGAAWLVPWRLRSGPGGGSPAAQPYAGLREQAGAPPAFWDELDASAAAALQRATPLPMGFALDTPGAAGLLLRAAQAGRLYLDAPPGDPAALRLQAGEPRPGTLRWQAAPAGGGRFPAAPLRLGWTPPPAAEILALPRPCWLDRTAGRIGPIDTALPEPLLDWLFAAPPVPPDAVDEVALALHAQLRDRPDLGVALPSPSARPIRERVGVPLPVLGLSRETSRSRAGAPVGDVLLVGCAMQYQDRRLEPLRASSLGVRDDDGLALVLCDHDAERARLAELRAALLPLLAGEPGAASLPEPPAGGGRSRPGAGGGWQPVARLPVGSLAAARVLFEVAPALAAAGWIVTDEARLPLALVDADRLAADLAPAPAGTGAAPLRGARARALGEDSRDDATDRHHDGDGVAGGGPAPPGRRRLESETGPAGARWFELQVGVRVAGRRIDLAPVLAEIVAAGGYEPWRQARCPGGVLWLRLSEREVVRIDTARIEPLARLVTDWAERAPGSQEPGPLRVDAFTAAQMAVAVPELAVPPALASLVALRARLEGFEQLPEVPAPPALTMALRPYQRDGLAWLQFLAGCGLGGVLADDMGLGKTVQVLAHVEAQRAAGRLRAPVLVVAPTSLVFNWQDEAARHAPTLRVLALVGPDRAARFGVIDGHELVLTSYALLPRDLAALAGRRWHAVVADEAHRVKNPRTQAAAALRALDAGHRIALTGTPVENHLGELWSVMQFAVPGLLGADDAFRQRFRAPIERRAGSAEADERLRALERRIRPFLLRRTKEAVLAELPALTEVVRRVEMGREQRDLYESIRAAMDVRVREAFARGGFERGRIVVLDALLKMRQACCDPGLLALPQARRVTRSAKREELLELLSMLLEAGRKVLVFSQFSTMLDRIAAAIDADPGLARVARSRLDGDTDDRRGAVESFQQGGAQLFLLSLKAGGVGLNLTAADTVIHYDPWWNPAVQAQATDRAHRIGQDKPVFVYKLVCAGTIEERMLQLQASKSELARAVLAGGQGVAGTLTRDDLLALFAQF